MNDRLPPWLKPAPPPVKRLPIPQVRTWTSLSLGDLAGLLACAFTFGAICGYCAALTGFFR